MAVPVIMPRQGQSVESCLISEVRKKKGDRVSAGEILFVYETDKATFEEEAKSDGVILDFFFLEGDEVPVLTTVCVIGEEGENAEEFRPGGVASLAAYPVSGSGHDGGSTAGVKASELSKGDGSAGGLHSGGNDGIALERTAAAGAIIGSGLGPDTAHGSVKGIINKSIAGSKVTGQKPEDASAVSPRARVFAGRTGVNASLLEGSGPHGRVIERDVREAADRVKFSPLARRLREENPSLAAAPGTGLAGRVTARDLQQQESAVGDYVIKPLTNIRRLIARSMYDSLMNSAQVTHHLGADARRIRELRKVYKKAHEGGAEEDITINDLICYATVRVLMKYPQVNAHFLGDSVKQFSRVHLGIAVDTDRGLMVSVIQNADRMSIADLSAAIKKSAAACRKGNIDPELLSAGAASFTVSNLGNYGVEMFTPVINLPQVAILGVNTIVLRPKELEEGVVGFVPYIGLSITYDHRAIDGGEATRFVREVALEIENLDPQN